MEQIIVELSEEFLLSGLLTSTMNQSLDTWERQKTYCHSVYHADDTLENEYEASSSNILASD